MTALLVGIDVGTSACKAAVVDEDGRELAHGKAPTPWRQVPTGAEADPEALFGAAVEAARAAVAAAPEGRVRGGRRDQHGRGRCAARAGRAGVLPPSPGTTRGGRARRNGPPPNWARSVSRAHRSGRRPLCTLAKLRWLVDHVHRRAPAHRWLNVGEWVVRRLGGRDVAELSLSSRTGLLDLAAKAPLADALAWAEMPDDLLPELVLAGAPAGTADGGGVAAGCGAPP